MPWLSMSCPYFLWQYISCAFSQWRCIRAAKQSSMGRVSYRTEIGLLLILGAGNLRWRCQQSGCLLTTSIFGLQMSSSSFCVHTRSFCVWMSVPDILQHKYQSYWIMIHRFFLITSVKPHLQIAKFQRTRDLPSLTWSWDSIPNSESDNLTSSLSLFFLRNILSKMYYLMGENHTCPRKSVFNGKSGDFLPVWYFNMSPWLQGFEKKNT